MGSRQDGRGRVTANLGTGAKEDVGSPLSPPRFFSPPTRVFRCQAQHHKSVVVAFKDAKAGGCGKEKARLQHAPPVLAAPISIIRWSEGNYAAARQTHARAGANGSPLGSQP